MHIPDGFLDLKIAAILYTVSIVAIAISVVRTRKTLGDKQIPLLSLLTAGVFAAQMLNFPIVGGTSGHLVGGTLIAVFLGPSATVVSMTVILVIQGLVFADGGITALGANIFNMGVIPALTFFLYVAIKRGVKGRKGILTGAAVVAWLSVVLGAVACGLELGFSYPTFLYNSWVTVPMMAFWHVIIGVGEAIITSSILAYVLTTRPDLLSLAKTPPKEVK